MIILSFNKEGYDYIIEIIEILFKKYILNIVYFIYIDILILIYQFQIHYKILMYYNINITH